MTVASTHMPVTAAHARSQPCCHQGVAEERIQAAITAATASNTREALIQRRATCLATRGGAATNLRSRT